ncbi:MAG TPA: histidine phosphatase family protein [Alphaproteobacteria bacterium]|nr:histidine phosphatase family protein [Alphaproteobacteria bacterium]
MAAVSLALIRHGPTEWNASKRIQGSTDIPLSDDGRKTVRGWKLPAELKGFIWVSSPLARARETARILQGVMGNMGKTHTIETDPRLREMSWGDWEGEKLDELRRRPGPKMAANEARGLDFRPPGGESPRELQNRLKPWLTDVSNSNLPVFAVTHHGVIRAIYALASGWDMTGKRPMKFHTGAVHFFRAMAGGAVRVERMNVAMDDGKA